MAKPSARSIHKRKVEIPIQLSTEPERVQRCLRCMQNCRTPTQAGDVQHFMTDVYEIALMQLDNSERQRFLKLLSLDA